MTERYVKLPDGGIAWEPDLFTEREQTDSTEQWIECRECGRNRRGFGANWFPLTDMPFSDEFCLTHGCTLVYDRRSGFDLCPLCEGPKCDICGEPVKLPNELCGECKGSKD